MAKKTVLVSDISGVEIGEGKGAKIRISFEDSRKGAYEIDCTAEEAEEIGKNGRGLVGVGAGQGARRPEPHPSSCREAASLPAGPRYLEHQRFRFFAVRSLALVWRTPIVVSWLRPAGF
jgi:hypothetical protein